MEWKVGQTVMVQSRTWANINKPGGCAKITRIHTSHDHEPLLDHHHPQRQQQRQQQQQQRQRQGTTHHNPIHGSNQDNGDDDQSSARHHVVVEGLDVKYVVGGGRETNLDPAIVSPYEGLERAGRSRRGREFLMPRETDLPEPNRHKRRANHKQPQQQQPQQQPQQQQQPHGLLRDRDTNQPRPRPAGQHRTKQRTTAIAPARPPTAAAEPPPRTQAASRATSKRKAETARPGRQQHHQHPRRAASKKPPNQAAPVPGIVVVAARGGDEWDHGVSPMWMDAFSSSSAGSSSGGGTAAAAARKPGPPPGDPPGGAGVRAGTPRGDNNDIPGGDAETGRGERRAQRRTARGTSAARGLDFEASPDEGDETGDHRRHPPPKQQQHRGEPPGDRRGPAPAAEPLLPATSRRADRKRGTEHRRGAVAPKKTKTPLLDVYRREVEKAREFMDEMVGGPRPVAAVGGGAAAAGRFTTRGRHHPPPSQRPPHRPQPQRGDRAGAETNSRYREFLSHLYKVWIRIDDEEEISEKRFREVFHEVTGNSFSTPELESHIDVLCDEGKDVMRSDGMLYRIH